MRSAFLCKSCIIAAVLFAILLLFNECLIYPVVLSRCRWPLPNASAPSPLEAYSRVMIVADTHLLGIKRGHWFDKLRREWQMYRAFQVSMSLFNPQLVFFLGDLLDEGLLGPNELFSSYAHRFEELFYVPKGTRRYVLAGNHDIGFHNEIFPLRINRFTDAFQLPRDKAGVKLVVEGGNIFVLLNSMAMEGDGCRLCSEAQEEIEKIAKILKCTRMNHSTSGNECRPKLEVPYSRPIILQHFPLYRRSDAECDREANDLAPSSTLQQVLRPNLDCLSRESTRYLIDLLRPRTAFGGHTHYGCRKWWRSHDNFWEHTVPSFSWRNNHRPSFLLVTISPKDLLVNSCFLPDEYLVIGLYVLYSGALFVIVMFKLFHRRFSLATTSRRMSCALLLNAKKISQD